MPTWSLSRLDHLPSPKEAPLPRRIDFLQPIAGSLNYDWDLNNDGVFTDATGVNPTIDAAHSYCSVMVQAR